MCQAFWYQINLYHNDYIYYTSIFMYVVVIILLIIFFISLYLFGSNTIW